MKKSPSKAHRSNRPKRVRAGAKTARARQRAVESAVGAPSALPRAAPELSERQRRHLRGAAHELKPVVRLGNAGLTEAVVNEAQRALQDHELIKVKAPGGDRDARNALFLELARRTNSALIQRIGNVAVLYRPGEAGARNLLPEGAP